MAGETWKKILAGLGACAALGGIALALTPGDDPSPAVVAVTSPALTDAPRAEPPPSKPRLLNAAPEVAPATFEASPSRLEEAPPPPAPRLEQRAPVGVRIPAPAVSTPPKTPEQRALKRLLEREELKRKVNAARRALGFSVDDPAVEALEELLGDEPSPFAREQDDEAMLDELLGQD